MLLKFGLNIQSQIKTESGNQKYPICPPGSHFESDIAKKSTGFYPYTPVTYCSSLDFYIQSQIKVKSPETGKSHMATRRPFWKWFCWKSLGFCPQPQMTCTWNLKLKFQSKLDLCSGNHAVSLETKNLFWKWRQWKSVGFYPYIHKYYASEVWSWHPKPN